MKKLRVPIIGMMLLVTVAAVTMLIMPSRQAVAQNPNQGAAPVEIVKPLPLPVTGNVGITGTPTINFSNTSSTPLFVRDVDRPTAQPFNYSANLTWVSGFAFANANGAQNFQVPAGKRLVIEFVSLQAQVPPGDNVLFARLDGAGAVLSVTHAGTDFQNNESFTATHRVFSILGAGTTVIPTAFCKGVCTSSNNSLGLTMFVSGYLTDAP